MNTLSRSEQSELDRKFREAIANGQFKAVANMHGFPNEICQDGDGRPRACCPHNDQTFLFWHRLLLVNFEDALDVAVPFWDWTDPRGDFPSVVEGAWPSIFQMSNLPRNLCPQHRQEYAERRRGQIPPNRDPRAPRAPPAFSPSTLLREVELALDKEQFEEFSDQIATPHNNLHNHFFCNLATTEAAAFDPIFWLHHSFVDSLLTFWQELQRLRRNQVDLDHRQASSSMDPFHRRGINRNQKTFSNSRLSQAVDHKKFCYDYSDLKINGKTPGQYHEEKSSRFRPSTFGLELEVGSTYFVGVVLPKMVGSGYFPFEICAGDKCTVAGGAPTFGSGFMNSSGTTVSKETHKIIEFDVTEVIDEQGWFEELDLRVKMARRSELGVPQPILVERFADESRGGRVTLGPGGKPAYGDLLEKYDYRVIEFEVCMMSDTIVIVQSLILPGGRG